MAAFIVSVLVFAVGLVILPAFISGLRVRGSFEAMKAGLMLGLLSSVLGKVLLALLKLIFFLPIIVTGPLGAFAVQCVVNAILLTVGVRFVNAIELDSTRATMWTAAGLTVLQMLAANAIS
jgi:uncharacterized membrane protein YvlD (DUF360 family)